MSNNFVFHASNPTEYIENRLASLHGPSEDILKAHLKKLHYNNFDQNVNKRKLAKTLIEAIGIERCEKLFNLGISAYYFKQKFNCDSYGIKRMLDKGLIRVTGAETYVKDGQTRVCKLYSCVDYYSISLNDYLLWDATHRNEIKDN